MFMFEEYEEQESELDEDMLLDYEYQNWKDMELENEVANDNI